MRSWYAKAESGPVMTGDPRVGLCAVCANVRRVKGGSDATFYLCELSLVDSRFRKYPGLPVARCDGFTPSEPSGEAARD